MITGSKLDMKLIRGEGFLHGVVDLPEGSKEYAWDWCLSEGDTIKEKFENLFDTIHSFGLRKKDSDDPVLLIVSKELSSISLCMDKLGKEKYFTPCYDRALDYMVHIGDYEKECGTNGYKVFFRLYAVDPLEGVPESSKLIFLNGDEVSVLNVFNYPFPIKEKIDEKQEDDSNLPIGLRKGHMTDAEWDEALGIIEKHLSKHAVRGKSLEEVTQEELFGLMKIDTIHREIIERVAVCENNGWRPIREVIYMESIHAMGDCPEGIELDRLESAVREHLLELGEGGVYHLTEKARAILARQKANKIMKEHEPLSVSDLYILERIRKCEKHKLSPVMGNIFMHCGWSENHNDTDGIIAQGEKDLNQLKSAEDAGLIELVKNNKLRYGHKWQITELGMKRLLNTKGKV